jgi:MFS transporter, ACS family, hexuronate transporter
MSSRQQNRLQGERMPLFRRMYALRWWMISLITIGTILNYLTRAMLGVAAPTLTHELGIGVQEYSWITGIFQVGILFQPVAGYVMDSIGLKLGFGLFALA